MNKQRLRGISSGVTRRRTSILQILSIVLMLLAWGVASNRCALATVVLDTKPAAEELHKCCSENEASTKELPAKKSAGECCQKIQALPTADTADLVVAPNAVLLFELFSGFIIAPDLKDEGHPSVEGGPPDQRSFAEVVLQRSLLSHAPPFAV